MRGETGGNHPEFRFGSHNQGKIGGVEVPTETKASTETLCCLPAGHRGLGKEQKTTSEIE